MKIIRTLKGGWGEREKERQRQREREAETDRQTDREDRETEKESKKVNLPPPPASLLQLVIRTNRRRSLLRGVADGLGHASKAFPSLYRIVIVL